MLFELWHMLILECKLKDNWYMNLNSSNILVKIVVDKVLGIVIEVVNSI